MIINGNTGIPTEEDRDDVDAWFGTLSRSLACATLPTSDLRGRRATADEFDLMTFCLNSDGKPCAAAFKHSVTRNYLNLSRSGTITIPVGGPFYGGTFDPGDTE